MNQEQTSRRSGWLGPHTGIVVLVFLAVISFFMLTQHRLHLFGVLPYLLLLACPIMHFFMHRRHGSHGAHTAESTNETSQLVKRR
jgi:Protein of unknown function (DUF2933)